MIDTEGGLEGDGAVDVLVEAVEVGLHLGEGHEERARVCVGALEGGQREGLGVGAGALGLPLVTLAVEEGVVDATGFSIAIVVTIVTTIAAPLLLKAAYQWFPDARTVTSPNPALAAEFAAGGQ